jgi:hypothetical protein
MGLSHRITPVVGKVLAEMANWRRHLKTNPSVIKGSDADRGEVDLLEASPLVAHHVANSGMKAELLT